VEIVLVRHAQPEWEPGGRAVDDPGLTELGHAQARCVADALAGEHFDTVLVSPLRRVVETAAPVLERLDVEARHASWLREMTLSSLEGHTTEQVRSYFEQANARALEHWWDGMPGGESFRHFYERVSGGLEGLLAQDHRVKIHEEGAQRLWRIPDTRRRILVLAHEGTNAVLVSHLLGIDPVPWAHLHFSSSWAGISRLHSVEITGGALFSLESFNRVDHLAALDAERSGRSFAV
jgi:probable phosphoglycerate mutase